MRFTQNPREPHAGCNELVLLVSLNLVLVSACKQGLGLAVLSDMVGTCLGAYTRRVPTPSPKSPNLPTHSFI